MLLGTSSEHVHQNKGVAYSSKELKGYYNDLREKVTIEGPSILKHRTTTRS